MYRRTRSPLLAGHPPTASEIDSTARRERNRNRFKRALPLVWRLVCAALLALGAGLLLNALDAHAAGTDPDGRYQAVGGAEPAQEDRVTEQSVEDAPTLAGFRDKVEEGAITVRESTPTTCLPGDLKDVVTEVAARFGPVSIQSTHRAAGVNRRAGGARGSLHIACRAIDFRVAAQPRAVLAFLEGHEAVGGLKLYRNGIIHIDDGERRSW